MLSERLSLRCWAGQACDTKAMGSCMVPGVNECPSWSQEVAARVETTRKAAKRSPQGGTPSVPWALAFAAKATAGKGLALSGLESFLE